MTIIFYGLLVWLTKVNFSWMWFSIAVLMQFVSWTTRGTAEHVIKHLDEIDNNNHHLGGPYA